MSDTHISFYLKVNRIHVFVDSLRGIGCPRRICFMISDDGKKFVIIPYPKKDLRSHGVPAKVYNGDCGMDISSYKLCRLIADLHHWDNSRSYRIPGTIYPSKSAAVFDLTKASFIDR